MIIRIFIALLALNLVAFVVRAEAAERMHDGMSKNMTAVELYEQQKRAAVDYDDEDENVEAFSQIGSRLLTLTLFQSKDDVKRYASQPAQADHGIALIDEGACLNLKWNF
jgi:basic membrane lipoprotein Med (substrate-binding protein (PBP1-ABC) superfamily)